MRAAADLAPRGELRGFSPERRLVAGFKSRPDTGLTMGRQGSSLGARALGWPRASTSGPGPHTALCSLWGTAPGPSHGAPTRTCDVRVREQLPLHLQSADFEPSVFDDVHRGAALDPVHAVLVGCCVPWETKGAVSGPCHHLPPVSATPHPTPQAQMVAPHTGIVLSICTAPWGGCQPSHPTACTRGCMEGSRHYFFCQGKGKNKAVQPQIL